MKHFKEGTKKGTTDTSIGLETAAVDAAEDTKAEAKLATYLSSVLKTAMERLLRINIERIEERSP